MLHLRRGIPRDAPALSGLLRRVSETTAVSQPDLEADLLESGEAGREVWCAFADETLVGLARLGHAWWTNEPDCYSVEVTVDPAERSRGVGSALFEQLRRQLVARGAGRALTWVKEDEAPSRAFATSRGFRETGQAIQEYTLQLEAAVPVATDLELHLSEVGIRLTTLADVALDAGFLCSLYRLWSGTDEVPAEPERLVAWRAEVVDGPGLSLQTHWVALHGDRPVGMTFLRQLSAEAAENDYTAVAPEWRRRGVALALKQRAIAWGCAQGLVAFHTSSERGNLPMIRLNQRLGYRSGAVKLQLECSL
jgi:GNAT superfamily N-acetyltransferase